LPSYTYQDGIYSVITSEAHGYQAKEGQGLELSDRIHERDEKEVIATVAPVKADRRVCGMRKKILIGLVLCIVLLIAIVGGAVGGVLATRSKQVRLCFAEACEEVLTGR
jgi:hypothetical protein